MELWCSLLQSLGALMMSGFPAGLRTYVRLRIISVLPEHLVAESDLQGCFGLDYTDYALVDKLHEEVAVLDFQTVERTADSLEQGRFTTAVHTADKNNRAVVLHR